MHNSDASHAIAVDPARWSIEPAGVDAEVDAEVAKMKKAREDAKKAAEDRVAAAQLAEDRKAAIAVVMANRAAKANAEKADKIAAARAAPRDDRVYPSGNVAHGQRTGVDSAGRSY
jgi:uncharacterized protein YdgA (DUF945 family)